MSACSAAQPGIEVQTVEVVREVQRPCPVTIPKRPDPLPRPLPADAVALSAVLGAKLLEVMGPGGHVERLESALRTCAAP